MMDPHGIDESNVRWLLVVIVICLLVELKMIETDGGG